jgi:hypothetical protein
MPDIPSGATVLGEYLVLHDGIHNDKNNPHPQYMPATKIVVLTQTQYDSLPSAKNTDGNLYFIRPGA